MDPYFSIYAIITRNQIYILLLETVCVIFQDRLN